MSGIGSLLRTRQLASMAAGQAKCNRLQREGSEVRVVVVVVLGVANVAVGWWIHPRLGPTASSRTSRD